MLRVLLNFFSQESCGKCTPCRVGTKKSFEILKSIESGKLTDHAVTDLRMLAHTLQKASFCGLGQSVALPMNSALDHFPEYFQPR
jgi:NADH-quinone oxidoreductase subunit F